MKVLICPISGGKFVNQAAGLYTLLENGFVPDTSIGASGGSVVISILLYAFGSPNKIRVFLGMLDGSMFVDSWMRPFPAWIVASLHGAIYRHSDKFMDFGTSLFTNSILQRHEIWILTYNKTMGSPHLFTTQSESHSRLTPTGAIIQNIREDVPTFCKAVLASSSVPGIVPSYPIGDHVHTDGGIYASTPLILFLSNLKQKKKLHLVYLTCMDLDTYTYAEEETILGMAYNCANSMNRNAYMRDRLLCIHLMENFGKVTYYSAISVKEALSKQDKSKSSFIEVYPRNYQEIDITSFTSQDVLDIYDTQLNGITCRMWLVED